MSKKINPAQKFINHHSFIIFITVATLGLSVIIWLCYQTYYEATNPANLGQPSLTPTSFDKTTEEKLIKLHTRDDSNNEINIPTDQRINPFAE